jgi:hypothetical protein
VNKRFILARRKGLGRLGLQLFLRKCARFGAFWTDGVAFSVLDTGELRCKIRSGLLFRFKPADGKVKRNDVESAQPTKMHQNPSEGATVFRTVRWHVTKLA